MGRRLAVPMLSLILVLGTHLPVAAADDAPNRCGQIGHSRPVNQWISGTIDSPADVDWYRIAMPDRRTVRLILGDLPADYRMDVYRHCGGTAAFHFHDYRPGLEFEELILATSFDPWVPAYVRISGVSGASSPEPYHLRAKIFKRDLFISSSRAFNAGGRRHLVGEVVAVSGASDVQVKAALVDSSGAVLGTLTEPAMVSSLEYWRSRRRTPFEIVFDLPPGYDHYVLSVTAAPKVRVVRALVTAQFDPFVDVGGIVHFAGEVRNNNDVAIDSLDVFVTVYDSVGRVLNVAAATTTKEHVGAKGKSAFDASFSHHVTGWNRWRAVADAVLEAAASTASLEVGWPPASASPDQQASSRC